MAWPFSDDNAILFKLEKRLSGSANESRVRIYINTGNVFDQVRLQQNGFAAEVELEQANRSREGIHQPL
jgi:hypothetical protein